MADSSETGQPQTPDKASTYEDILGKIQRGESSGDDLAAAILSDLSGESNMDEPNNPYVDELIGVLEGQTGDNPLRDTLLDVLQKLAQGGEKNPLKPTAKESAAKAAAELADEDHGKKLIPTLGEIRADFEEQTGLRLPPGERPLDQKLEEARLEVALMRSKREGRHVLLRGSEARVAKAERAYWLVSNARVQWILTERLMAEGVADQDGNIDAAKASEILNSAEFQTQLIQAQLDEEVKLSQSILDVRTGKAGGNIVSRWGRRMAERYAKHPKARSGIAAGLLGVGATAVATGGVSLVAAGALYAGQRMLRKVVGEQYESKVKAPKLAKKTEQKRSEFLTGDKARAFGDVLFKAFTKKLDSEQKKAARSKPGSMAELANQVTLRGADLPELKILLASTYEMIKNIHESDPGNEQIPENLPQAERRRIELIQRLRDTGVTSLEEAFSQLRPEMIADVLTLSLDRRLTETRTLAQQRAPWFAKGSDWLRRSTRATTARVWRSLTTLDNEGEVEEESGLPGGLPATPPPTI